MRVKSVTNFTLSLDLGSNLGWATHSNYGVQSGVLSLKDKGKFSLNGFGKFYAWLIGHKLRVEDGGLGRNNFKILVEVPHCGKFMAANRILFGLLAVVNMFGVTNDIEVLEFRPKAIKKFWSGNGNADKKRMVAETQRRGYIVKDHNQSDAIAQLEMYLKGVK